MPLTRRHRITWGSLFVVAILCGLAFGSLPNPQPAIGLYFTSTSSPTAGGGVAAPLGQILFRQDVPSIYFKTGAANTAWTLVGTGSSSGGTVTSIACGTGLSCSPSSPITTAGTINVSLTPTSCTTGSAVADIAANGTGTCVAFAPAAAIAGTIGYVPAFATASSIDNSHMDDGVITAAVMTITGESLAINSNGQSQLFSTFVGANSDGENIWIGGGGQVSIGDPGNHVFGSGNVSLGWLALLDMTTGNDNTALGAAALQNLTTGGDNTAIGRGAMNSTTQAHQNTAIGSNALALVDDPTNEEFGWWNTAVGLNSYSSTTSGWNNVGVGFQSGQFNVTGDDNTCVGVNAGAGSTTHAFDTLIGSGALRFGGSEDHNTVVGGAAAPNMSSGSYSTIIGTGTGGGITTGDHDTIIGAQIASLAATLSNTIVIADGNGNSQSFQVGLPTLTAGTLEGGSNDWWGSISAIGPNTSVAMTYSQPFQNRSRCVATTNGVSVLVETIVVTARSKTSITFSCYSVAAVPVLSNCDDFTYECSGQ